MKRALTFLLLLSPTFAQPSLTIYNDNFAVVRQDVPLTLEDGTSSVSFDQVTSLLEPDSVVLRDPTDTLQFQILEQNYRNDPVSQSLLLSLFEGKEISFLCRGANDKEVEKKGTVIRSGYVPRGNAQTPIIKMDDQMQFSLPGKPLFPSLGDDSILCPTLTWQLNSTAGEGTAQLSYLSAGFAWKADYNLIVTKEQNSLADLNGWVTLTNNSGTKFEEAKVQLLAGDVNKVNDVAYSAMEGRARVAKSIAMADQAPQVTQKELDSYHLYSVARPVTLQDKETKQVQFLTSNKVTAKKAFVYEPQRGARFYGRQLTNAGQRDGFPKDVSIYWTFANNEENGLGIPMPKGKIRLYQKTEDNQLEFLGDNVLGHTPQKEDVEFYTGNAFDLIGERRMANFDYNKLNNTIKETVEIKLRNRSKETATIQALESMHRWKEWHITEKSHAYEKLDAHSMRFTVTLKPDEEAVITYTVKYSWN